jgi:hypothetical protein
MLDAAREAMRSAAGHTRSDLDADFVWTLGLAKGCWRQTCSTEAPAADAIPASDTRPRVITALRMLETKSDTNPPKKHGNIPL